MTQQNREFKELLKNVVVIKQLALQKLVTRKRKTFSKNINSVILTSIDDIEKISLFKSRVKNLKDKKNRFDFVKDASNLITTIQNTLMKINTLENDVNKQSQNEFAQLKSRLKLAHYIENLLFSLLNSNHSSIIFFFCKDSFNIVSINFNFSSNSNTQSIFSFSKRRVHYLDDFSLIAFQKSISLTLFSLKFLRRTYSFVV